MLQALKMAVPRLNDKVALMMIQNKNSCTLKELKSSMRSCEVEELETHEMVDDGFSISGKKGKEVLT